MKRNSEQGGVAQTVLLSSLLTTVIIAGVLFIARDHIGAFLLADTLPSALPTEERKVEPSPDPVVETIATVNPAVVSVIVTKDVPIYERYYETYDPFGLFGGFSVPRVRENGTEEREVGGGSGFVVSNDGLIVTNRHVVDDEAARYSVIFTDGTVYAVDVLARDPQLDIAILQISDSLSGRLPYLRFGDSSELRLGEQVIAIGNALAEFQNSVSVGVVSGLSRSVVASDGLGQSEQLSEVIQTDAAINPGNSGGPLLNIDGEVIGVNVATSHGAENIGFALPSNAVRGVVDSVREYGTIVRPYLGVRYMMVNEQVQEVHGLAVGHGALLLAGASGAPAVVSNSPAAQAGLQAGDVILAVSDVELTDTDLAAALRLFAIEEEVTLTIWREGETFTVPVVLTKSRIRLHIMNQKPLETMTTTTLNAIDKVVKTTEQEIEHVVSPIRTNVLRRFPVLFLLAVTFGVTAVTTGMQQILIQYQILQNNPWLILLIGLLVLVVTGTIYKKLG